MKKIKILHLISSKDFLGAERVISELARISDPEKISISVGVLSSSQELSQRFKDEINRDDVDILDVQTNSKWDFSSIKKVLLYINTQKINIIHSHNYKSNFYGFFIKILSKNSIGLIASNHNWILSTPKEKFYKNVDAIVLKRFNAIVAISEEIKNEMIRVGINLNKIKLIKNGISFEKISESTPRGSARCNFSCIKNGDIVIGCVASLTPEKGHIDLIKAIAEVSKLFPQVKLLFIGDGEERAKIESTIMKLALEDKVFLAGFRKDVRSLYRAFDIFALPSYREGLPMALLEAMAAGIPVISTPVGSIPDLIQDGINGVLTLSGDVPQLAQCIVRLLADDESRRLIGEKGALTVKSSYSSQRMAREYEALYYQVSNSSSGSSK